MFTVGNAQRIQTDAEFAAAVAVDLSDYLMDLRDHPERALGSGRLYLPKNTRPKP